MLKVMFCIIRAVLDILTHPLVEPYAKTAGLVNIISKIIILLLPIKEVMDLNPELQICFYYFKKWKQVRS
jgi:hypothetical protein